MPYPLIAGKHKCAWFLLTAVWKTYYLVIVFNKFVDGVCLVATPGGLYVVLLLVRASNYFGLVSFGGINSYTISNTYTLAVASMAFGKRRTSRNQPR